MVPVSSQKVATMITCKIFNEFDLLLLRIYLYRVGEVEQSWNKLVNLKLSYKVEDAVGRHINCTPSRNNKGPEKQNGYLLEFKKYNFERGMICLLGENWICYY